VASDGVDSIFTLLMDRMETMQKGAPHVQLHILRLPTLSWLEALKVKSGYLFYVGRQLFRHNPTEDQCNIVSDKAHESLEEKTQKIHTRNA